MDRNEIVLSGRLSDNAEVRTLPSGDTLTTWKLSVRRPGRTRESVTESFDCVTFDDELGRSVAALLPRDVIEVHGALRRRFFSTRHGRASVHEIVARSVRLLERTLIVSYDKPPPRAGRQGPEPAEAADAGPELPPLVPRPRRPPSSEAGPGGAGKEAAPKDDPPLP
ncbi:single-stranded DNA-binding protein [Spongiactinospora sp. TRM90649]|uniref:single-stranded DNA-binding protein n=1 Tax=Spongiactinospora sp. TRM90649 TaxID=3031114 RepID=UPI0023F82FFF|nr:single-stranded DNA-binding protein [Spongiactinospora sp. TRM90649]MDF5759236.1 single-stranded DNA-binding protein [Spongiactinospora sp. TRM90649]